MTENKDTATGDVLPSTGQADNELERLAARLLEDLSEDPQGESRPQASPVMLSEKYRGPFSHPSILRELDKVIENGAERGFQLTEKEQEFRHARVREILDSEIKHRDKEAFDRRLVIILIFSFLLLCLIGAFVAVMMGHNTGAALVAGAGAVITGGALLIARSSARRSSEL